MSVHPALLDLVRELTAPKHPDYLALRRACPDVRALVDVLASGVDPDSCGADGASLLHQSDLTLDVVQLLLAAGADADAPWYTGHGRTPLFFATTPGVPTLLFQAGADLESRDVDGLTPLLFNIQYGSMDMVEELLALGVDDAVEDDAGLDALDYAEMIPTEATRERMVDILLQRSRAFVLRNALQEVAKADQPPVETRRRF